MADSIATALLRTQADLSGLTQIRSALTGLAGDLSSVGGIAGGAGAGFGVLGGALGTLAGPGALLGIAGGLTEAANASVEWASKVKGLQHELGSTAQEASKLVGAAQLLGIQAGTLETGLGRFEKALHGIELAADAGSTKVKPLSLSLGELGVKTNDAEGKLRPMTAILSDLADSFQGMADGPQKQALAMELFGRAAGPALVPFLSQGSAGIDTLMQKVQDAGLVIDEQGIKSAKGYKLAVNELGMELQGLSVSIGSVVVPALTQLAAQTTTMIEKIKKDLADLRLQVGGGATFSNLMAEHYGAVTDQHAQIQAADELRLAQDKLNASKGAYASLLGLVSSDIERENGISQAGAAILRDQAAAALQAANADVQAAQAAVDAATGSRDLAIAADAAKGGLQGMGDGADYAAGKLGALTGIMASVSALGGIATGAKNLFDSKALQAEFDKITPEGQQKTIQEAQALMASAQAQVEAANIAAGKRIAAAATSAYNSAAKQAASTYQSEMTQAINNLKASITGMMTHTADTSMLSKVLGYENQADEPARRLAAVAANGFKDEWAQKLKGTLGQAYDDALASGDDSKLRKVAADKLQRFTKFGIGAGQLFDKGTIEAEVKQALQGQGELEALKADVLKDLTGQGFSGLAVKQQLGAITNSPDLSGLKDGFTSQIQAMKPADLFVNTLTTGVQTNLAAIKTQGQLMGQSAMDGFISGASGGNGTNQQQFVNRLLDLLMPGIFSRFATAATR